MKNTKENNIPYYEIRINKNGKKVCIVNGKEKRIIAESSNNITLEDGTVMGVYGLKNKNMEIFNEGVQGEADLLNESRAENVRIHFSNLTPKGDENRIATINGNGMFYEVIAIPGIEEVYRR